MTPEELIHQWFAVWEQGNFEIYDIISQTNKACVRYTSTKGDFTLDVSEWHYCKAGLIQKIVAYYHIGDISADKQIDNYS